MTEYMPPPEAYREYMTSRERCAYWVQSHSSDPDGFYSPSVPPIELGGFIPSSPPSDAGSSYSLPPKMVLKYNDGRPDIPIPRANQSARRRAPDVRGPPHGPPSHSGYQHSHTSASVNPHPSSPTVRPPYHSGRGHPSDVARGRHPEFVGADASSPEEIRVLPSRTSTSNALPPRTISSNPQRSHHTRSKSLPRTVVDQLPDEDIHPIPCASPRPRPIIYPPPTSRHPHGPPHMSPNSQTGPRPWYGVNSSSGSSKHSQNHSTHKVPSAVPAHQGRKAHYPQPAILYHQPPRGPDGMVYSHSAPVQIQGGSYPAPFPPNEYEERGRQSGRGLVHKVARSDGGEESDGKSAGSGSTYYVLPSAGQKKHVIAPSPEQSIRTSTSTTKSPGPGPKKPFFQRLFSFAKIESSTGGSTQGTRRKLQRRHSVGDSKRPDTLHVHSMLEDEITN